MTVWFVGDVCPTCGEPPSCEVLVEYIDKGHMRDVGHGCTRHKDVP